MSIVEIEELEATRVSELVTEFLAQGYSVHLQARLPDLPATLESYRPDILATRGQEHVVVEVRVRGSQSDRHDFAQLAETINARPGWSFRLIYLPATLGESVDPATVRSRVETARVLRTTALDASFLLAWSAVEGAIRFRAIAQGKRVRTIGGWLVEAVSADILSESQYELLRSELNTRNRLVHGLDAQPSESRVDALLELAEYLVDDDFVSVSGVIEWFTDHYESPVHHLPHDSREGGYQYYAGGPYDAREVIQERFNVPASVLDDVVGLLEEESTEWVRKGQYP